MSVFVGPVLPCPPDDRFEWPERAVLFADSVQELHDFAVRLGLLRAWFRWDQPNGMPHYPITGGMRAVAIKAGAVPLSEHEAARRESEYRAARAMERNTGSLFGGGPDA